MQSFHETAQLVFIQTEGGMTAFYPKWYPIMLYSFYEPPHSYYSNFYLPNGAAKDVYQSEYYRYTKLWPDELSFTSPVFGMKTFERSVCQSYPWVIILDGKNITVTAAIHDAEYGHSLAGITILGFHVS